MSGTDLLYGDPSGPAAYICGSHEVLPYRARDNFCSTLPYCATNFCAMSGIDIAYAASLRLWTWYNVAPPLYYRPTLFLGNVPVLTYRMLVLGGAVAVPWVENLQVSCAMCRTDRAYPDICLCSRYAMSGTGISPMLISADAATKGIVVLTPAHATATRLPVLTYTTAMQAYTNFARALVPPNRDEVTLTGTCFCAYDPIPGTDRSLVLPVHVPGTDRVYGAATFLVLIECTVLPVQISYSTERMQRLVTLAERWVASPLSPYEVFGTDKG
eukprot:1006545-Rhodomonas_salina.2